MLAVIRSHERNLKKYNSTLTARAYDRHQHGRINLLNEKYIYQLYLLYTLHARKYAIKFS